MAKILIGAVLLITSFVFLGFAPRLLTSNVLLIGGGVADGGDILQVVSNVVRVGFLLDEYAPYGMADLVAADVLQKSDAWWEVRARKQLGFTLYKLQFMSSFYKGTQQMMLPSDPAAIKITFTAKAKRHSHQGHDVISRPYSVNTFIVAQKDTAALASPNLASIGGQFTVTWELPMDPYLLYQRSGYACADEDQFPHNSLDAEAAEIYYDDTCTAGPAVPPSQECLFENTGCHCTFGADYDCPTALQMFVGRVHMSLAFTRVAWDEDTAAAVESLNSYQVRDSVQGADLVGHEGGMKHNWIVYRYFATGSCESLECIVGGSGWRRLLIFDSIHVNIGRKEVAIGKIAYKAGDASSFNQLALHNMYYWDPCHQHPHFSQYCNYQYNGAALGHKQGFCIQSTNRIVNSRDVSLVSPYQNCSLQGVSVGWADNYNGGIPCQWVDVTGSLAPVIANLTMIGNPSAWLCEGIVSYNSDGSPQWQPTGSLTNHPPYPVAGLPIDIYQCTTTAGALKNNIDDVPVALPKPGDGLITSSCGDQMFGPSRDCGFTQIAGQQLRFCTPGITINLQCFASGIFPQILRVCESSTVLQSGTACRYNDTFTLANVVLAPSAPVRFTCPAARDSQETGGLYSFYSAPLYNPQSLVPISCA